MHEMSLAEGIVQLVEDAARAEGCTRVRTVWLEIGQLAAVEQEALRFCFDAVTRDSVAEGARLEIIETPGQGWCMQCERNVAVAALYDPCPDCGSYQVQVTGGSEMRVKELEVE
jgi:hydrogenase nickel incorporation protein HypA/HybF